MNNWVNGIPYELAYWKGIFSNKNRITSLLNYSKLNSEIELSYFDAQSFLKAKQNPIVVDAGCGMSFAIGNRLGNKELNVFYIDPLAPFYNKVIQKEKLNFPNVTFGFIEYISSFIPQKASLIIVQNALDHSENPIKGIIECMEGLEINGVLYLKHFKNEAETEHYKGFHQFNICIENDELIIWNKDSSTNISSLLQSFAHIKTVEAGKEVFAIITKKSNVPEGMIDYKKNIEYLSNQYIQSIENFNEFSFSFNYQWSIFKFRMIQIIVQQFNFQTRQQLKKIIKLLYRKN